MGDKAKYTIEGQLRSTEAIDFAEADLTVYAVVAGKEVGNAHVDRSGGYHLTFNGDRVPPGVELRLLPSNLGPQAVEASSLVQAVSPRRFTGSNHGMAYCAAVDIRVPESYVRTLEEFAKETTLQYNMSGHVYAFEYFRPITINPPQLPILKYALPAARLDFYEVNQTLPGTPFRPLPQPTEHYLGTTLTTLDGSYQFSFKFTTTFLTLLRFGDGRPDIKVRISQFQDGDWWQVLESSVTLDIPVHCSLDYIVPVKDVIPRPLPEAKPVTGFRYTSIGRFPVDSPRLVKGYATSQPGDPICLDHQPFCGTLRLFGLFAKAPNEAQAIKSYQVQVASADENGQIIGPWEEVLDPLSNLKWNDNSNRWDLCPLGPDPTTHRYMNIDTEPEANWVEHALKVTWNSANKPDGYYVLKIIGYDAKDKPTEEYMLPVLRVDNSLPHAELVVKTPVPTQCGGLTLGADRKITFKITAYSPAGHILAYTLSGVRGLASESAGVAIVKDRKSSSDPSGNWVGVHDQDEIFSIAPKICSTMAYSLRLVVQGAATDGYSSSLTSRQTSKETNLVVSE